jgi:hypothetical protein
MRVLFIFCFVLLTVLNTSGQSLTLGVSFKYEPGRKNFALEKLPETRFGLSRYQALAIHDTQVISIRQPGTSFDHVYFIDQHGRSQLHTLGYANTEVLSPWVGPMDSFNPTGAVCIGQFLTNGIINRLLQR